MPYSGSPGSELDPFNSKCTFALSNIIENKIAQQFSRVFREKKHFPLVLLSGSSTQWQPNARTCAASRLLLSN